MHAKQKAQIFCLFRASEWFSGVFPVKSAEDLEICKISGPSKEELLENGRQGGFRAFAAFTYR
jgi:hypothetical protein